MIISNHNSKFILFILVICLIKYVMVNFTFEIQWCINQVKGNIQNLVLVHKKGALYVDIHQCRIKLCKLPVSHNLSTWVRNDIQMKTIFYSPMDISRAIFHSYVNKQRVGICTYSLQYHIDTETTSYMLYTFLWKSRALPPGEMGGYVPPNILNV